MKNKRQKAASKSDSLAESGVCNKSLVSSLIHEKPYSKIFLRLVPENTENLIHMLSMACQMKVFSSILQIGLEDVISGKATFAH